MLLTYGEYEHPTKTTTPRVESEPLRTNRGQVWAIRQTVTVSGEVNGDSTSDVADAVESLIAAYATDGLDFVWSFTGGEATPEINLISDNCWGGVRVVRRPSFVAGEGGEYSNYRKFELAVQGDVLISGSSFPVIWEYQNSYSRTGTGGAVHKLVPLKNEPPQKQQVRRFSVVTASQTWRVVGTLQHLPTLIPRPLWPFAEKLDQRVINRDDEPQQVLNGTGLGFALSGSYQFEHNGPLAGLP